MGVKGREHTEKHRQRIARGMARHHEVKRETANIASSEILEVERTRTIAPSCKSYARQALEESRGLLQGLRGESEISKQRTALVQDVVRAPVASRGLGALVVDTGARRLCRSRA